MLWRNTGLPVQGPNSKVLVISSWHQVGGRGLLGWEVGEEFHRPHMSSVSTENLWDSIWVLWLALVLWKHKEGYIWELSLPMDSRDRRWCLLQRQQAHLPPNPQQQHICLRRLRDSVCSRWLRSHSLFLFLPVFSSTSFTSQSHQQSLSLLFAQLFLDWATVSL